MKRFYCTVCKRVKRVRRLPRTIDTPTSPIPTERVGKCDRHSTVGEKLHVLARKIGRVS